MTKTIDVTELALRDAHQSLMATRMAMEDMIPACADLDQAGFWSLECWGGATFDACIRFLNEDPWERLRQFRKLLPNTRLQMLLRGQNLLGYRHYEDTVVDRFVEKAAENGMDVFRVFDALNDIRNLRRAVAAVRRTGKHAQGTICYTVSPLHTPGDFVEMAEKLLDLGCDSLCIKDMAGLIAPYAAYELVGALKKDLGLPVDLHTHYTSGMGSAALLKAVEAGLDVMDTAISSMSLSTSQPPTETLVACLRGTEYDTGLDLDALAEISRAMAEIRRKYASFEAGIAAVDVNVLQFQVPGGMLSNLVSQLRQQGAMDKYYDVLAEIPRVRAELGYPPLVTPSSQIVGTQATLNVVTGERYKVIPEEVKQYIRGNYGKPPAPIDPAVQRKAIGDEQPITCRPADLLGPGWERAKREIGDLAKSDEDILSYALFPQIARPFLERRARGMGGKEEAAAAIALALFQHEDAKAVRAQAAVQAVPGTAWKMAGRRDQMARGG